MPQEFEPGDFLVFQLEAGFAVLRVLAVDDVDAGPTWHLAAYRDFFPDVEAAEAAALGGRLATSDPHLAVTNRGFESTQVARVAHTPLADADLIPLDQWRNSDRKVSDRSVRLLLGLR